MFDIGFTEVTLIAVIGLLVIGPERLPRVAREIGLWVGRLRRYVAQVRADIEREVRADELRELVKKPAEELKEAIKETEKTIKDEEKKLESDLKDDKETKDTSAVGADVKGEAPEKAPTPATGEAAAPGANSLGAESAAGVALEAASVATEREGEKTESPATPAPAEDTKKREAVSASEPGKAGAAAGEMG